MICKDCGGKGKLRTYINGRVLSVYCYCESGKKRESERDEFVRSLGSDVETDRKYRLRYAKGEPKRY